MNLVINEKQNIEGNFTGFLEDAGLIDKLRNAKTVVVKPNFAGGKSRDGNSIVDLDLLGKIIKKVIEINDSAIIYIAESDSLNGLYAYKKFNHLRLPESIGFQSDKDKRVKVLDITRDQWTRRKHDGFLFFCKRNGYPELSKTFDEAGFLISLANVKTHILCTYSGACKNLFGCMTKPVKNIYHGNIHKVIHDVNLIIKPDISILDGFRGMQGNGPIHGDPVDLGFMVFSDDPVEADFVATGMAGLNPMKIKYLRLLAKHIVPPDLKNTPSVNFKLSKPSAKIRLRFFIKRLVLIVGFKLIRRGI